MKRKIVALNLLMLVGLCEVAGAQQLPQVETLDYQGALMTGTATDQSGATMPFSGSISAELVVQGTTLTSYVLHGLVGFISSSADPFDPGITLTTDAGGDVNGALINFDLSLHTLQTHISVGPGGDNSFWAGSSPGTGICDFICTATVSNSHAGVWTEKAMAAPEIAPASAASGLTMLLAGLAVLSGRRNGTMRLSADRLTFNS